MTRSCPTAPCWVVLPVLLLLGACAEEAPPPPPSPPPAVTVVRVGTAEITNTVEFIGRTEAVAQVDLIARVEGVLETRHFQEGNEVEGGQLLFSIEDDVYQARLDSAAAALAAAQAEADEAQRNVDRLTPLREQGATTAAEYDQAVATRDAAAAQVQVAAAELRQAELNLSYTRINAPLAGRMSAASVTVGNVVSPASGTLAQLTQLNPIYVSFDIAERDVLDYKERQLADNADETYVPRLRLANDTLYGEPGRIDFVASQVDDSTGTVALRAVFPNPEQLLIPGQYVSVILEQQQTANKLVIPQSAVQQDQAGRYVLVVDDTNTAQVQRIVTGERSGTDWVVEEGLTPGARVIFEGIQRVRPGQTVQATEVDSATPGEG